MADMNPKKEYPTRTNIILCTIPSEKNSIDKCVSLPEYEFSKLYMFDYKNKKSIFKYCSCHSEQLEWYITKDKRNVRELIINEKNILCENGYSVWCNNGDEIDCYDICHIIDPIKSNKEYEEDILLRELKKDNNDFMIKLKKIKVDIEKKLNKEYKKVEHNEKKLRSAENKIAELNNSKKETEEKLKNYQNHLTKMEDNNETDLEEYIDLKNDYEHLKLVLEKIIENINYKEHNSTFGEKTIVELRNDYKLSQLNYNIYKESLLLFTGEKNDRWLEYTQNLISKAIINDLNGRVLDVILSIYFLYRKYRHVINKKRGSYKYGMSFESFESFGSVSPLSFGGSPYTRTFLEDEYIFREWNNILVNFNDFIPNSIENSKFNKQYSFYNFLLAQKLDAIPSEEAKIAISKFRAENRKIDEKNLELYGIDESDMDKFEDLNTKSKYGEKDVNFKNPIANIIPYDINAEKEIVQNIKGKILINNIINEFEVSKANEKEEVDEFETPEDEIIERIATKKANNIDDKFNKKKERVKSYQKTQMQEEISHRSKSRADTSRSSARNSKYSF